MLGISTQFITVGNVYSIDLDRFVSASMSPVGTEHETYALTIRLKGSGFLRFLKYSHYRIIYKTCDEATKDMKMLVDAANRWQSMKMQQKTHK
jgi:hypothetical protein